MVAVALLESEDTLVKKRRRQLKPDVDFLNVYASLLIPAHTGAQAAYPLSADDPAA
jgi:hypothetical protein